MTKKFEAEIEELLSDPDRVEELKVLAVNKRFLEQNFLVPVVSEIIAVGVWFDSETLQLLPSELAVVVFLIASMVLVLHSLGYFLVHQQNKDAQEYLHFVKDVYAETVAILPEGAEGDEKVRLEEIFDLPTEDVRRVKH